MSIKDIWIKIKSFSVIKFEAFKWHFLTAHEAHIWDDYIIITLIVLIGLAGFGLGRLSSLEERHLPTTINNLICPDSLVGNFNTKTATEVVAINETVTSNISSGQVVASKTGKRYHFPWCGGAKQISDKNKIYFATTEAARAAGYLPATNCPGLN
jgi:hypothetical protein